MGEMSEGERACKQDSHSVMLAGCLRGKGKLQLGERGVWCRKGEAQRPV